jgi:hypothetical protein
MYVISMKNLIFQFGKMSKLTSQITGLALKKGLYLALFSILPITIFAIPKIGSTEIFAASSQVTYQSPKFGFKITYPNSYTLDKTFENKYPDQGYLTLWKNSDYQAIQAGKLFATETPSSSISISAFSNPNKLSALQWVNKNTPQSNFNRFRQGNYKSLNFVGQSAISYSWCGLNCGDNIVFPSKNGQYIITLNVGYGNKSDKIRQDFQKIISTFKLTK